MKSNGRPTNRVLVSPFMYQVVEDDKLSSVAGASGGTMPDTGIILVDPGLGPDAARDTLLHEALHAMWNAAMGAKGVVDSEMEETIIAHLSPRLLAFLRDNEGLVEWMQEPT